MNTNNLCPPRNDLESYFNGSLSAHNLELISQHILECEKCVSILETIEANVPKPQIPNLNSTNAFGNFSPKILKKVLDMGVYLPEKTQSLVDRVLAAKQLGQSVHINQFSLVGLLGMGSSGIVFEALDEKLNRKVAIKFIIHRISGSKMQIRTLENEAKAIAAVKHESLVDIYEIGEWDDLQFIVMPFLAGENLATRLNNNELKPLALDQVIQIATQIAQGLNALHEAKILHRDLKPSNIWLTKQKSGRDKIIILDLGLAHKLDSPINDGLYFGTLGYMSPEQTYGDTLDVRSDLFSFGCVLFQMLNGEPPFSFASRIEAITYFRKGLTPDLRLFQDKIPDSLGALVRSLMAVNPENRPATIAEVIKQLKTIEKKLSSPPYSRRQVIATVLGGSLLFSAGLFLLYKQVSPAVFETNSDILHNQPLVFENVDKYFLHPSKEIFGIAQGSQVSFYENSKLINNLTLSRTPGKCFFSACGEFLCFHNPENISIYSYPELIKVHQINQEPIISFGFISKSDPKKFFYCNRNQFFFVDLDQNHKVTESELLPLRISAAVSDPRGRGIVVVSDERGGAIGLVSSVLLITSFNDNTLKNFYKEGISKDIIIQTSFCSEESYAAILSDKGYVRKFDIGKFFSTLNEYTNESEVRNIGWKNKEILTFLKDQVVIQKAKPLRILKSNYESLINTGNSSLKNLALHMEDKQLFVWNWK